MARGCAILRASGTEGVCGANAGLWRAAARSCGRVAQRASAGQMRAFLTGGEALRKARGQKKCLRRKMFSDEGKASLFGVLPSAFCRPLFAVRGGVCRRFFGEGVRLLPRQRRARLPPRTRPALLRAGPSGFPKRKPVRTVVRTGGKIRRSGRVRNRKIAYRKDLARCLRAKKFCLSCIG